MKGIDLYNLTPEQKAKLQELKGKRYTKSTLEYRNKQEKEDKIVNNIVKYMNDNNIEGKVINNNGNFSIERRNKRNK